MGRMKEILLGYLEEWDNHDCHAGPEDSCMCQQYADDMEYANARFKEEYGDQFRDSNKAFAQQWNDLDSDDEEESDDEECYNSDDICEDCGDPDCDQDRDQCPNCGFDHCDNYDCNDTPLNWNDLDNDDTTDDLASVPKTWDELNKTLKAQTWNDLNTTPGSPGVNAPTPATQPIPHTINDFVCLNSLPMEAVRCDPLSQKIVTCKKCGKIAKPVQMLNGTIYAVLDCKGEKK